MLMRYIISRSDDDGRYSLSLASLFLCYILVLQYRNSDDGKMSNLLRKDWSERNVNLFPYEDFFCFGSSGRGDGMMTKRCSFPLFHSHVCARHLKTVHLSRSPGTSSFVPPPALIIFTRHSFIFFSLHTLLTFPHIAHAS